MNKTIIILLYLTNIIFSQGVKVSNPLPAFGDTVQYQYDLHYWQTNLNKKKIISEINYEKVRYNFFMYGENDFRIEEVLDGVKISHVLLDETVYSANLVEVRKTGDQELRLLFVDPMGYHLYWLEKNGQSWDKKMLIQFFVFLPGKGRNFTLKDVKQVSISNNGGLSLFLRNLPEEVYSILEKQNKVRLNGKNVGWTIVSSYENNLIQK